MPNFQQRHYEALAQILQDTQPKPSTKAQSRFEYREQIIRTICRALKADNKNFNEDRFRLACMPGADVHSRRNSGPAMPYYQGAPQ